MDLNIAVLNGTLMGDVTLDRSSVHPSLVASIRVQDRATRRTDTVRVRWYQDQNEPQMWREFIRKARAGDGVWAAGALRVVYFPGGGERGVLQFVAHQMQLRPRPPEVTEDDWNEAVINTAQD